MRLAVGIAHAAWDQRRRAPLRRLLERLPAGVYVRSSEAPETSWIYARSMWRWAAAQPADAVLLLNDDIEVCDDLVLVVKRMCDAVPGRVLGLHAQGEAARALAERGANWCRAYNLTGPANVASPAQYRAMFDYWSRTPDLNCAKDINEDNVASQWMWDWQEPAWLPLPSPVRHDATIPSAIGYDHHEMRTTSVPWSRFDVDMTAPSTWAPRTPVYLVPWIENPWFPVEMIDGVRRRRLHEPTLGTCWFCGMGDGRATSTVTGARVCVQCAYKMLGAYMPPKEIQP